jgi:hypothetical protein
MDNATFSEMQSGKLCVRVGDGKLQRSLRLGPASPHFADVILKTVRQVDACTMCLAGNRIEDRFPTRLDPAWNVQPRCTSVYVNLEIHFCEDRIVDLFERRRKHLEKVAPGSVSNPLMMRNSASRCSVEARSSMIGTAWPLPSWMAPGQATIMPHFNPSSLVVP